MASRAWGVGRRQRLVGKVVNQPRAMTVQVDAFEHTCMRLDELSRGAWTYRRSHQKKFMSWATLISTHSRIERAIEPLRRRGVNGISILEFATGIRGRVPEVCETGGQIR